MERLRTLNFSEIQYIKDEITNVNYKTLSNKKKREYLDKITVNIKLYKEKKNEKIELLKYPSKKKIFYVKLKLNTVDGYCLNEEIPMVEFNLEEIYIAKVCLKNKWLVPPRFFFEEIINKEKEKELELEREKNLLSQISKLNSVEILEKLEPQKADEVGKKKKIQKKAYFGFNVFGKYKDLAENVISRKELTENNSNNTNSNSLDIVRRQSGGLWINYECLECTLDTLVVLHSPVYYKSKASIEFKGLEYSGYFVIMMHSNIENNTNDDVTNSVNEYNSSVLFEFESNLSNNSTVNSTNNTEKNPYEYYIEIELSKFTDQNSTTNTPNSPNTNEEHHSSSNIDNNNTSYKKILLKGIRHTFEVNDYLDFSYNYSLIFKGGYIPYGFKLNSYSSHDQELLPYHEYLHKYKDYEHKSFNIEADHIDLYCLLAKFVIKKVNSINNPVNLYFYIKRHKPESSYYKNFEYVLKNDTSDFSGGININNNTNSNTPSLNIQEHSTIEINNNCFLLVNSYQTYFINNNTTTNPTLHNTHNNTSHNNTNTESFFSEFQVEFYYPKNSLIIERINMPYAYTLYKNMNLSMKKSEVILKDLIHYINPGHISIHMKIKVQVRESIKNRSVIGIGGGIFAIKRQQSTSYASALSSRGFNRSGSNMPKIFDNRFDNLFFVLNFAEHNNLFINKSIVNNSNKNNSSNKMINSGGGSNEGKNEEEDLNNNPSFYNQNYEFCKHITIHEILNHTNIENTDNPNNINLNLNINTNNNPNQMNINPLSTVNKNKFINMNKDKNQDNHKTHHNILSSSKSMSLNLNIESHFAKELHIFSSLNFEIEIVLFSSEEVVITPNLTKEKTELQIKESWENNQPGRSDQAVLARKRWLSDVISQHGGLLADDDMALHNSFKLCRGIKYTGLGKEHGLMHIDSNNMNTSSNNNPNNNSSIMTKANLRTPSKNKETTKNVNNYHNNKNSILSLGNPKNNNSNLNNTNYSFYNNSVNVDKPLKPNSNRKPYHFKSVDYSQFVDYSQQKRLKVLETEIIVDPYAVTQTTDFYSILSNHNSNTNLSNTNNLPSTKSKSNKPKNKMVLFKGIDNNTLTNTNNIIQSPQHINSNNHHGNFISSVAVNKAEKGYQYIVNNIIKDNPNVDKIINKQSNDYYNNMNLNTNYGNNSNRYNSTNYNNSSPSNHNNHTNNYSVNSYTQNTLNKINNKYIMNHSMKNINSNNNINTNTNTNNIGSGSKLLNKTSNKFHTKVNSKQLTMSISYNNPLNNNNHYSSPCKILYNDMIKVNSLYSSFYTDRQDNFKTTTNELNNIRTKYSNNFSKRLKAESILMSMIDNFDRSSQLVSIQKEGKLNSPILNDIVEYYNIVKSFMLENEYKSSNILKKTIKFITDFKLDIYEHVINGIISNISNILNRSASSLNFQKHFINDKESIVKEKQKRNGVLHAICKECLDELDMENINNSHDWVSYMKEKYRFEIKQLAKANLMT